LRAGVVHDERPVGHGADGADDGQGLAVAGFGMADRERHARTHPGGSGGARPAASHSVT
jgi:hypothetical protein